MIPKRIVAIGTSAFFGLFDNDHEGGYIGRFKKWHEEKDINNEVYNLGISREGAGETTTEMCQRIIPEASARQPDLILLTTGINDIRRIGSKENPCVTSAEQFEENIHTMITSARSVAKDVIFISAYPIKDKKSSKKDFFLNNDLQTYTKIAKKACEVEGIPFIDVFLQWQQKDYAEFLGPDGVHANAGGYEQVFEQMKSFFASYFQ